MALQTFSMPGFPVLRGLRTRLRAPRADDVDRLFALFSDPETMRYWPRAPMRLRDEALGYIDECVEHFARGDRIDWVVTTHRGEDAIGTCTLYDIDLRLRRAELGYALLPAHRGRGLATDAATQAIAWAMRTLQLQRIDATADPRNEASRRVLERLGFARDATGRYSLSESCR
jgi:RimJ/RimL family protein N-acetyltransferase